MYFFSFFSVVTIIHFSLIIRSVAVQHYIRSVLSFLAYLLYIRTLGRTPSFFLSRSLFLHNHFLFCFLFRFVLLPLCLLLSFGVRF